MGNVKEIERGTREAEITTGHVEHATVRERMTVRDSRALPAPIFQLQQAGIVWRLYVTISSDECMSM